MSGQDTHTDDSEPNPMTTDELEQLSTHELHHRAMERAIKHADIRFLWRLLSMVPAAEAASGDLREAEFDVQNARGVLTDALHSDEGKLGDALRPVYIEYLRAHGSSAGSPEPGAST